LLNRTVLGLALVIEVWPGIGSWLGLWLGVG